MNVIDIHTHAFPDAIAKRAMAKLMQAGGIPSYGDGTITGLLASMDAAGSQTAVVCPIATRPDQADGILKWCSLIRSPRIVPMPSVHPDDPAAAQRIRQFAAEGFAGVKMHPQYQGFAADDAKMDPLYEALAETKLLLVSHCGLDLAYPPEDDCASPVRFARVIERFPALRLLCTHMGGWRSWDLVEKHLIGKDILLETSFSLDELGKERAVAMIRRHGVDRVLFGSDWPWKNQRDAISMVQALGLTPAETDAVLAANSARILSS